MTSTPRGSRSGCLPVATSSRSARTKPCTPGFGFFRREETIGLLHHRHRNPKTSKDLAQFHGDRASAQNHERLWQLDELNDISIRPIRKISQSQNVGRDILSTSGEHDTDARSKSNTADGDFVK